MNYVILVGDGMGDYPMAELGGKTPLEAAKTPAMDELARRGELGAPAPSPRARSPAATSPIWPSWGMIRRATTRPGAAGGRSPGGRPGTR